MAILLGPNDMKQYALPTYWDASYIRNQQLASGENYDQLITEIAAALVQQNQMLLQDPLVSGMASVTDESAIEYAVGVSNGFGRHTEYTAPDAPRAATTGHMLPLLDYDRGFSWTWSMLQKARRRSCSVQCSTPARF